MPINSKQKGSDFERKVAKMLSDWSGEKFMRTPMSGAIHNFKDKRVVSDIVAPLSIGEWPFSIECKKVECSWSFNTFIEGTSQTLKEHWKQCCEDSDRESLVPLLVFNKNYRDVYAMVKQSTFETLGVNIDNIQLNTQAYQVTIFRFADLLDNITVEELLKKKF